MYQLDNNGSGEVLRPKFDGGVEVTGGRWSIVERAVSMRVRENPDYMAYKELQAREQFNNSVVRTEQAATLPSQEVVEHSADMLRQRVADIHQDQSNMLQSQMGEHDV